MKKRILVVDDDAVVRTSCERILASEGHQVTAVTGADHAVSLLERDASYDLLIVDIKMPLRDGYSLMQEVKRRWPFIPIVVTSGYPTSDTIVRSRELGAVGFVPKPFSPAEMLDALNRISHREDEA